MDKNWGAAEHLHRLPASKETMVATFSEKDSDDRPSRTGLRARHMGNKRLKIPVSAASLMRTAEDTRLARNRVCWACSSWLPIGCVGESILAQALPTTSKMQPYTLWRRTLSQVIVR
jgi:hypothetical protein